jgi:cytochrome c553
LLQHALRERACFRRRPGGRAEKIRNLQGLPWAGRQQHYLVKALKDYKSGARKNAIMAPMAANLSTRDIEDLAAYFSGQKGLVLKH